MLAPSRQQHSDVGLQDSQLPHQRWPASWAHPIQNITDWKGIFCYFYIKREYFVLCCFILDPVISNSSTQQVHRLQHLALEQLSPPNKPTSTHRPSPIPPAISGGLFPCPSLPHPKISAAETHWSLHAKEADQDTLLSSETISLTTHPGKKDNSK